MSRTCQVCGRSTTSSQSRSHSNIANKRTQKINVQTKNIDGEKIKVCAKCIKTATKNGKSIKELK